MCNGHVINNKDDESYGKALVPYCTLTDTFPQGSSLAKWSCEVSSLAMAFSKDLQTHMCGWNEAWDNNGDVSFKKDGLPSGVLWDVDRPVADSGRL